MTTFKLKYKKYMKAVSVLVGIAVVIAFTLPYVMFYGVVLDWVNDNLPYFFSYIALLTMMIIWAFIPRYVLTLVKNKAVLDSDFNAVKVYSLSNIFWRTTDIDTIESIIVHRNSELLNKWIDEDAIVVTLVTRHHRISFPISEDDWLMFKNHPRIINKTIIE